MYSFCQHRREDTRLLPGGVQGPQLLGQHPVDLPVMSLTLHP